jgi:uncharacterized membrane protein YjjP (DUF1212 family)
LRFLAQLGGAMTAAGELTHQVDERLQLVAAAYGARDAHISVLPGLVVLSPGPGQPTVVEDTSWMPKELRLDQVTAVFDVVRRGERGALHPAAGTRRLQAILASPSPAGTLMLVVSHVVLTVGLCLVLRPTAADIAVAAVFGALVGLASRGATRVPSLAAVMPVLAACGVSAGTFALARAGWIDADLQAMIPPLLLSLPGVTLMTAVVELAAGEAVAGAARLASGVVQLLLLAFGIVVGAQLVGAEAAGQALVQAQADNIGWWGPWLGVLVFALGMRLYFSAPRRALPWLLLVLYAGWIAQVIGDELVGGYVSAFLGAFVMAPLAYLVARQPTAPPALVTLVPGFWLLVPGALSLFGVAKIVGGTADVGDLVDAGGTIVAIGLGALCGYPLYRSAVGLAARMRSTRRA